MLAIIAIFAALGAGLFIGNHLQTAREAHRNFSSYRTRTNRSLGNWLKGVLVTSVAVMILAFLLYLALFYIRIR
jgi:predicted PurR-regulated permease PerM